MSSNTHRPCSPSGADRWMACPASVSAVEEMYALGLSDESPYASEGTQAHDYAARVLKGTLELDAVPEEFRAGVTLYVNSINFDLEFGGELISVEESLVWGGDGRVGGTPDCVHRINDCLVVTDFKYGAGEYVSPDAMQLKIYGFLVWIHYADPTTKHIELRIVQPRYEREGVEPIRSTFWDAGQLVASVNNELRAALAQIDANPDLHVPGDHCQWCPKYRVKGMPPCPAHLAAYQQLIDSAPLDEAIVTTETRIVQMSLLDQLKFILDHEDYIQALLKLAKANAVEYLERGEVIPGYSLKESLGNRKWAQDDEVIAEELEALGLPESQIWDRKVCSPAQAEKRGLKGQIDELTERESKGFVLQRDKGLAKEIKKSLDEMLSKHPLLLEADNKAAK